MMKKFFYLAIAAVMSVALASCGGDKEPEVKAPTINLTVSDVTYETATINAVPSVDTVWYFLSLAPQEAIDAEFANFGELAEYLVEAVAEEYDEIVEQYGAANLKKQYGIESLTDYLEYVGYIVKGTQELAAEGLYPETNYAAFAFVYDADSVKATGDVFHTNFTTAEVSKINLTFHVTENDTAYFLEPSIENASYLATFVDKDSLGGYTPTSYYQAYVDYTAQQVETYSAYGIGWEYFLMSGTVYVPKANLEAGHSYYILASGVVNGGVVNSDVFVGSIPTAAHAPALAPRASMVAKKAAFDVKKTMFAPAKRQML